MAFITDAPSEGIQGGWYLTDLFAGFEIWTGTDATDLQRTKPMAAVK